MLTYRYDHDLLMHIIEDDADGHEVKRFSQDDFNEGMEWYTNNRLLGTRFHKLEQLIEAVNQEMIDLSSNAEEEEKDHLGFIEFPHVIRWKLHVAACSIRDYTFWVYKCDDDGVYWRAYEVETGVHHDGVTAREALELHFKQSDVLDLPRNTNNER